MNEVRLIDANALNKEFQRLYNKCKAVHDSRGADAMIVAKATVHLQPTIEAKPAEITLAEYEALKSENEELRQLLQSAYDGYMSIVSCKYAPCKECIHDSEPRCAEDWIWKWKHAEEVLKLFESIEGDPSSPDSES